MTIVFAEKAHKSWPYTSVTNVSDELGNTGGLNEFQSLWKFRIYSRDKKGTYP